MKITVIIPQIEETTSMLAEWIVKLKSTANKNKHCKSKSNADAIIDYVFVSKEAIYVLCYETITDEVNGMLPSDHYPIYIEYDLI